jgi:FMN-dependent NADH-azoreductase
LFTPADQFDHESCVYSGLEISQTSNKREASSDNGISIMAATILKLDTSGRAHGSASRAIVDHLVHQLMQKSPGATVVGRDIARGLPLVDDDWIAAAYADPSTRTTAQRAALGLSDELVAELQAADIIVIGLPMYNFTVPASFKAWIDQVCRARVTFRFSETGIEGLLKGKKAYVVVATGGVPLDAPVDFLTPYVRHILGFVGISDVTVIDAGRLNFEGDSKISKAKSDVEKLAV